MFKTNILFFGLIAHSSSFLSKNSDVHAQSSPNPANRYERWCQRCQCCLHILQIIGEAIHKIVDNSLSRLSTPDGGLVQENHWDGGQVIWVFFRCLWSMSFGSQRGKNVSSPFQHFHAESTNTY